MLSADWYGTVVQDKHGDMYGVDVMGDFDVTYLGTTQYLMYDLAFAPNGVLYGIGGSVYGPSMLYQLNVNFENPGGAIETVFLGQIEHPATGPLYLNGFEFSPAGGPFVVGYNSYGQEYIYSLSLSDARATQAFSLGAYQSAGDLTFDTDGYLYVSTMSGDLLQIEPDMSGGQWVGYTGVPDFYGLSYGPGPTMIGYRWGKEVYKINPDNGQLTFLAYLSDFGLDDVLGAATIFHPPASLGTVDFADLPDQDSIMGELWFRVETTRAGLLTAVLPDDLGPDVSMYLYSQDEYAELHEEAFDFSRIDFSVAGAGEEYFLRIKGADQAVDLRVANLVTPVPGGMNVFGTDGNDTFEYVAGATPVVLINGIDYELNPATYPSPTVAFAGGDGYDSAFVTGSAQNETATVTAASMGVTGPGYRVDVTDANSVNFAGGGGNDSAAFTGSTGNDAFTLGPAAATFAGAGFSFSVADIDSITVNGVAGNDTATFVGSGSAEAATLSPGSSSITGAGFTIQLSQVSSITFEGGGGADTVTMTGNNGADTATLGPAAAALMGAGFSFAVANVPTINVDGGAGAGLNVATFNGSAAAERVEIWPQSGEFSGAGYVVRSAHFTTVTANSGGGADVAVLHDSAGDDTLAASPLSASLQGAGFAMTAAGFAAVEAYASSGGSDTATFADSAGNDLFAGGLGYGLLRGNGFSNKAAGFDFVHVASSQGGFDTARLYDSDGDETLEAYPTESILAGGGFTTRVEDFREVHAFARGGHDIAYMHDSAGDDAFVASPTEGTIAWPGLLAKARRFDEVRAGATAGGYDTATLYDSRGSDAFLATPVFASFSGAGFYNEATGFDSVEAYAGAGDNPLAEDVASLYDSSGDDTLLTTPDSGVLDGDGYRNLAGGFTRVDAYASAGGYDTGEMHDSAGDDTFSATPTEASLQGAAYLYRAVGFEFVEALATAGGSDVARMYDSAGDDVFYGSPTASSLYGDSFFNRAKFFEVVYGDASAGGQDEAYLFDSSGLDLLEAEGSQARLSCTALDYLLETVAFDYVKATASTVGDTKDVAPSLDFVLDLEGPWQDL